MLCQSLIGCRSITGESGAEWKTYPGFVSRGGTEWSGANIRLAKCIRRDNLGSGHQLELWNHNLCLSFDRMQRDKFALGRDGRPGLICLPPRLTYLCFFSASNRQMNPLPGPRPNAGLNANAARSSQGWCSDARHVQLPGCCHPG